MKIEELYTELPPFKEETEHEAFCYWATVARVAEQSPDETREVIDSLIERLVESVKELRFTQDVRALDRMAAADQAKAIAALREERNRWARRAIDMEAERDRYREALETIASDALSGSLDRKQCARDYLDGVEKGGKR